MNSKNAHEYLPLVQALADGKEIQRLHRCVWSYCADVYFSEPASQYRIKPESTIRPFNADELRQLWLDGVIIKDNVRNIEVRIERYFKGTVFFESAWHDATRLLDYYAIPPQPARPNGGICGVEE